MVLCVRADTIVFYWFFFVLFFFKQQKCVCLVYYEINDSCNYLFWIIIIFSSKLWNSNFNVNLALFTVVDTSNLLLLLLCSIVGYKICYFISLNACFAMHKITSTTDYCLFFVVYLSINNRWHSFYSCF